MEDHELLREYAQFGSEAAFATLVQKHAAAVHSSALRQLNDPQLAEDVTQAVFLTLTRKAHRIGGHVVLGGWLHRATRFASLQAARDEARRRRREELFGQFALGEKISSGEREDPWDDAAPLLDDALESLGSKERETLLLRYFESKSHREISVVLGENEMAVKKRVSRALERLRRFFARRGVVITAAVLGETLATRAVEPAPPGVIAQVSSLVLPDALPAKLSVLNLAQLTMKAMFWSQTKWYAAALLVLGVSGAVFASRAFGQQAGWPDRAFNPTNRFSPANAILPLADGRLIVAGFFASTVGNESTNIPRGIVRLNADGSHDRSFAPFDEDIMAAALQDDGRIIVGGAWRQTNAIKRANLSRLHPDGSLDSTFDPGPGTDWDGNQQAIRRYVSGLIVQPDGKILVTGSFSQIAGEARPGLARLHRHGTLDESFIPTALPGDEFARPVLQPDGKILAFAAYPTGGGAVASHHVRLNTNGSLDLTFEPSRRNSRIAGDPTYLLAVQANGSILASVLGGAPMPVIRLKPDGTRDTNFTTRIERTGDPSGSFVSIDVVTVDSRDRILIGGRFTRVNGVQRNGLCRLNPDGSLDESFGAGQGFLPIDLILFKTITPDAQGRLLIGGTPSTTVQGLAQAGVVRLWSEPVLRLGALTRGADGRWLATVTSLIDGPVQLEASSDLVHWTPLDVITNGLGTHSLPDASAESGSRYYRAQAR